VSVAALQGATFDWSWQNQPLPVAYDMRGAGPPLLLLGAMSTIATRDELAALATRLAQHLRFTTVDWPGFGTGPRPPLRYRPALYDQFLRDVRRELFTKPVPVMAAGHGAGYALRAAHQARVAGETIPWTRAVLLAPTWRGPLPTAMGERRGVYHGLEQAVRLPLVGQALYRLNTTQGFIRMMYGRHVYADKQRLTPALLAERQQVARARGARFASSAFVTGALDPAQSRDEAFGWLNPPPMPVLLLVGAQTPPKSRAEMDALAALPGVASVVVPGALGLYEEYAEQVAPLARSFLESGRV
jgi:pimeloyl-ACP methyl ester carboxylesterase